MAVATSLLVSIAVRIVTAAVIITVNALSMICSLDAQHYIRGLIALARNWRTPSTKWSE